MSGGLYACAGTLHFIFNVILPVIYLRLWVNAHFFWPGAKLAKLTDGTQHVLRQQQMPYYTERIANVLTTELIKL